MAGSCGRVSGRAGVSRRYLMMRSRDRGGLPTGYKCEYGPRLFATAAGRTRHVAMGHKRAAQRAGITMEQLAAQQALREGDPHGNGQRDVADENGLVDCGVEGC